MQYLVLWHELLSRQQQPTQNAQHSEDSVTDNWWTALQTGSCHACSLEASRVVTLRSGCDAADVVHRSAFDVAAVKLTVKPSADARTKALGASATGLVVVAAGPGATGADLLDTSSVRPCLDVCRQDWTL